MREPSADNRAMAAMLHDMYLAFVQEGFTPEQAMHIIGTSLSAFILSGGK